MSDSFFTIANMIIGGVAGWHLGKKGDVKFCADCGRRIKWD